MELGGSLTQRPERGPRVLVLEDNPVQCALYEKILKAGHFDVLTISDPLDLVNNLDALEPPDAIFLDIVLPGMDGLSVLEHLEAHPKWCLPPVILMTASATRDRVQSAGKLPVPPEGFLAKPVDPQNMLTLVRAVIAGQEPSYLLRSLQRKRHSLRLGLRRSVTEVERTMRESCDAIRLNTIAIENTRKEIQSLKTLEAQLRDAPIETQLPLRRQITAMEESCGRYRQLLQEAEVAQKRVLQQRQDIPLKQKMVQDLERRIQTLSQMLRRNRQVPVAEAVVGPVEGAADE
jgi:CheY-like chemotaxis protein